MKRFFKYSLIYFVVQLVLIFAGTWLYTRFVPGDHSLIGLSTMVLTYCAIVVSVFLAAIKVGGRQGMIYFAMALAIFGFHVGVDKYFSSNFYQASVVVQKETEALKWQEYFLRFESPSLLEPSYDISIVLSNKNVPAHYLRKYSDSQNNLILWAIARNENLPQDVYEKLKKKNDPTINSFLSKNPSFQESR